MTPERFTEWLHGWTELEEGKCPSEEQWKMIMDHLNLVYNKVTPERDDIPTDYLDKSNPPKEDSDTIEMIDVDPEALKEYIDAMDKIIRNKSNLFCSPIRRIC